MTGVSSPRTGVWCFTLADPVPDDANGLPTLPVVVSADFGNSVVNAPVALGRNSNGDCPDGTVEVMTFNGTTPDNNVGFTFLVP